MTTDPYAAPKSHVEDAPGAARDLTYVPGGQSVSAAHGWKWFVDGWRIFMRQPGMWIGMLLVMFLLLMLINIVPFAGGLAGILLWPVFIAGVAIGCRTVDEGGELEMAHVFAGFREHTGPLVIVGLIYLAGWIVIILAVALLAGGSALVLLGLKPEAPADAGTVVSMILLPMLVALAISVPLMMAVWFSSALIAFHGLQPVDAMKASFAGCLKNIMPFLVYGAIGLGLSIVATIPLGLGWFALGPVFATSYYASYRDIFTTAN